MRGDAQETRRTSHAYRPASAPNNRASPYNHVSPCRSATPCVALEPRPACRPASAYRPATPCIALQPRPACRPAAPRRVPWARDVTHPQQHHQLKRRPGGHRRHQRQHSAAHVGRQQHCLGPVPPGRHTANHLRAGASEARNVVSRLSDGCHGHGRLKPAAPPRQTHCTRSMPSGTVRDIAPRPLHGAVVALPQATPRTCLTTCQTGAWCSDEPRPGSPKSTHLGCEVAVKEGAKQTPPLRLAPPKLCSHLQRCDGEVHWRREAVKGAGGECSGHITKAQGGLMGSRAAALHWCCSCSCDSCGDGCPHYAHTLHWL